MSPTRINAAVQECLTACRDSTSPITRLALYCVALRQSGWNEQDIHAVETAVVRLLAGVIEPIEKCPNCDWLSHSVLSESTIETVYRYENSAHAWRDLKAAE